MKLIGIKRAIIFFSLLALNLVIGGVYFLWLSPAADQAEDDRKTLDANINTLQRKIDSVQDEVKAFHKNLQPFKDLQSKGFMLPQDRLQLARDFAAIKDKSSLAGFTYTVEDIANIANPDADAGKLQLLNSEIRMSGLSPLTDTDVYKLLDLIKSDFPEHVRIESLTIQRASKLTDDALNKIQKKQDPGLFSANAVLDWMTVVPQQDDDQSAKKPAGAP